MRARHIDALNILANCEGDRSTRRASWKTETDKSRCSWMKSRTRRSCETDSPEFSFWGRPWKQALRRAIVSPSPYNPVLGSRSEEHTSELQSHVNLVCRLLLEKKKNKTMRIDSVGR